MLKRKYQPGGINEEGRLNTGAGKIDKSDTAKPIHESGQFVIGSALGKTGEDANVFYQTDEETVNQLITNKKLNIDDPNQYRNGLEDIKIANSMGKEDDRSFDDYAVLQRQGVYGTNRGFQDKMKRDAKNFNKETYKNIGEERKEDRGKGRSLIARTAINLFTNDKRQGEKAIKSADKVRKAVMYRGAFERPEQPVTSNYSPTVEVDTPAQQPQTTPTDKKVDYEWKEFTNGNDPYKYRVALDKASGNPLMYEYSKDGKTWKQQEETDKGNRTMERQSVISNLWKNYQQNPASMQPSQQRTTGRTGTGGSGRGGSRITTESQGITLGNKPVSNPYQGYQPKTQPITANNTLSPEYIAQNGFTGSGDKPATGEQPDWKDYLTYGTVVAGGILGADQIGKLLKTSQNSLVRSAGRLFKPNVVNITENPAVERGVSRLAGKEGKMLLNRGQVKTNTPQNPAANQQNPTYSPEVQVNTPAVTAGTRSQKVPVRGTDTGSTETRLTSGGNTRLKPGQVAEKPASNLETPFVETPALKSVSVGSPLKDFKLKGKNWADYSKEDRQHEGRTLAKILETKGDDYKGEGYQAEILQELKKSNPNIVKELRDAKGEELEKLIQKYFKKGGLVRKHQFGKKLVEGTKKAGKEAVTDTVIGNALDSRKSDRDFDMIDAVSLGASFVPGLNVASAAFDAGRNLYDEYKAGDLDSKDFVRNGLDFTTNLIPGAKAAKGAFKVTKQLMKPKTAAKVANLSKLIFTN